MFITTKTNISWLDNMIPRLTDEFNGKLSLSGEMTVQQSLDLQ